MDASNWPEIINNEKCLKDIFYRIRHPEVSNEQDTGAQERRVAVRKLSTVLENNVRNEGRTTLSRRHSVLYPTTSHEIAKRSIKRRSLDERFLQSGIEADNYSQKERDILALVLKNDKDDSTTTSSFEKAKNMLRSRIPNPQNIIKEFKNLKSCKNPSQNTNDFKGTINLGFKNGIDDIEIDVSAEFSLIGLNKKDNIFKRFLKCAAEKLPSTTRIVINPKQSGSPRAKLRRSSSFTNKPHKKDSFCQRRPTGNLELHAMLQKEYRKSSGSVCLPESAFNIIELVEQARIEYANKQQGVEHVCLEEQGNVSDVQKQSKEQDSSIPEDSARPLSATIFETFGNFTRDPFGDSKS